MTKKSIKESEVVLVEIMRASNLIEQPLSRIFKAEGITQTQYNILRILRGSKGERITAGQVKSKMVNSTSDCTRLTDRLVIKGLAKRETNPKSRREMLVQITAKGLKLLNTIEPNLYEFIEAIDKKIDFKKDKLIKRIHYQETDIRTNIRKNDHYFVYLLKLNLGEYEFNRLIETQSLNLGVSVFRNRLISQLLKVDLFNQLETEIHKSIKVSNKRNYSS